MGNLRVNIEAHWIWWMLMSTMIESMVTCFAFLFRNP